MQNSTIMPKNRAAEDSFRQALQRAETAGDIDSVRALFQNQQKLPTWAKFRDILINTYCNAVAEAVSDDNMTRAQSLLSEWSSDSTLPAPEAKNFDRSLPIAVMSGNRDLVKLLISHGARANSSLAVYIRGPIAADDETFEGILQDLLDAGWDFKQSKILANSASHNMPTSLSDKRLPPWLLKHGVNPNIPDGVGNSPMFYIAENGSLSTLQLLFECGAQVDNNALFAVVRRKNDIDAERIPMVQLLLSNGADINIMHKGEKRPSSSALKYSRVYRNTPLWEAVQARDVDMVEFLIRTGADVNLRVRIGDVEKSSPLEAMIASKCERLREIGTDIQSRADITHLEEGTSSSN